MLTIGSGVLGFNNWNWLVAITTLLLEMAQLMPIFFKTLKILFFSLIEKQNECVFSGVDIFSGSYNCISENDGLWLHAAQEREPLWQK